MIKYKSFEDSRSFCRGLGLKNAREWREYSRSEKRPLDIPSHPDRQYKDCGWISWMDWLNTTNVSGSNRIFTVNDAYFKKWSRNMAYILGFWYTDGYIDIKRNIFSITQHKKDKYILQKMLVEMGSSYKLSKHMEDNLSFKITSREIINDLTKLGGCERKSFVLDFPDVPKEYLPDFIRGLWDGDGCITFQKNERAYVSSFASASKKMIYKLLKILRFEIKDFRGTISRNGRCYIMNVGVNDTRRLSVYLYKAVDEESLYLERKREKFQSSGDVRIASQEIEFLSFKTAMRLARKNRILTGPQWERCCKTISPNLPSDPSMSYSKEWKGWKKFLGTNYFDFLKAREIVRMLGLKNVKQWLQYSKTQRPRNIPSNPWSVYKEWVGFADWLGSGEKT
jgi:hypothetical protein